ncbi:MAG: hypothetical protein GTN62_13825 [Gemmatimonadales bacterium]|nr:hypothetical protein [Gemmatimonadales bacterium]NIN13082.1 hypothetical protein [Gemmatimonadales bacterium]NIN51166.1 hypothetical protein [Gemmatimonadales bacterium]NIP08630.1 hypothetical protein [Gemmatimonadales bacterium]NIR02318.1 hypothetical protein [Gemmatimonadales bacterium]
MRRNTTWLGVPAACLALSVMPHAARAQQSILLRYHPHPRAQMQTVVWSDLTSTISEQGSADSITIEAGALQSITQRLVEERGAFYLIEVMIDSTRARTRPLGGAWSDVEHPAQHVAARFLVDDRFRISDVEAVGEDTALIAEIQTMGGLAPGFEFVLPEEPIAVGESWTADIVFPLSTSSGLEGEEGVAESLPQQAEIIALSTFTLDSLVVRPTDTLAYVRIRGSFLPTTVTEAGEEAGGALDITGAFGGHMIWSTAWDAFVSGAVRTRATVRFQLGTPEAGMVTMVLSLDGSTRFQVRP